MKNENIETGVYELIFKFKKIPGQWVYSMEDIDALMSSDAVIPMEWKHWKQGKSNYKPFSMQMTECKGSGNLYMEDCCHCGDKLLLCKKYGGQCISHKCKNDRVR